SEARHARRAYLASAASRPAAAIRALRQVLGGCTGHGDAHQPSHLDGTQLQQAARVTHRSGALPRQRELQDGRGGRRAVRSDLLRRAGPLPEAQVRDRRERDRLDSLLSAAVGLLLSPLPQDTRALSLRYT